MAENFMNHEKAIFAPVNLCREDGRLNPDAVGWSAEPLFNCNLSGRFPRKKRWNYWCTISEECLFSATISSLDYAGMVFVYFLDFKTNTFIEKTITTPLAKGYNIPQNVGETVIFENRRLSVKLLAEAGGTRILVHSDDFGGMALSADILVCPPEGHETLNVVIPWNEKTFQFTSKQSGLPSSGTLTVGNFNYQFKTDDTFSCLDFGRGIWPRKVAWNWATASGIIDGKSFGLNLGGKWTDGTGMTENAVLFDGKLSKISEDVLFTYDLNNIMAPWTIKSRVTDCVDLVFTPFYERVASTNLAVVKSAVHQMVGRFSGTFKPEGKPEIRLSEMLGCAEEHLALW